MAIIVRLDREYKRLPWNADGETMELTQDPEGAWLAWIAIILLCLRDKATSVHYHSWRKDDPLSYVVDGTRHELVQPPPEVGVYMVTAWRDRLGCGWCRKLKRALRLGSVEASEVCISIGGMAYDWYIVCWSLPGAEGVDLHLTSLKGRLAEAGEA